MTANTLFIFTKPNRIGLSKTRLGKDIGWSAAQRVNAMTCAKVFREVSDPRWVSILSVAPDQMLSSSAPFWPPHLPRMPQGGGSLGDRLARAYHNAPMGNVLFLGTDMPDVTRRDIHLACEALKSHEAVFGPADDGGFWILGLRKRTGLQPPFQKVRWSSEHAMADVCRNLEPARIARLREAIDLDDGEALVKWRASRKSA
ncbi:DUF2064 domain-containing protein [Ponticaulis sp.]|uniref:TIGR04282 family arsenosugar biosynthesis glycosyltransferase n=1 Tax=Ponticaulis sp. TaxID=2020902 RepID=UPI000B726DE2|nr:DUF2064 domain-containing protein [Ponticaulis sp.]MAI91480.1 hypothetical protein [Ponticaulis sp.]OUX97833.1 MAG: hypothetical protein CBB65_13640 [Hyphomonadaceae bacterium TMED5]|tara:strand:- start:11561 stop:12163 length:603 start_codon:yes stop_codon:yes gene_type:complete